MKIIFIRHGDPNYAKDCLTEKGKREAMLLAERVAKWESITQIYCSPLGRAKQTAGYSLEKLNREAIIYDWLQEFYHPIPDPQDGHITISWDFMPDYWTKEELFFDKENWSKAPIMQENPEIATESRRVYEELDQILAGYGYVRKGNYYEVTEEANREATIVIFCHLGVTFLMMSHLLNVSPVILWQSFFVAPTSVTIVGTQERQPGIADFRAQVVGDTNHLKEGNEPISSSGYFTDCFQK